jgi:pyrroloquinoline quinone (PQQ) biosynthesis protein C
MEHEEPSFPIRLRNEVLSHAVIVANPYTPWFERGEASLEQARAFLIQFSVFSNQFLVAQLHKMLNADTLEAMHESKEILANEIGVGFRARAAVEDPELGSTSGSIDGGTFRFRAAHFELLVRMAEGLGLRFEDLGRRRFGTASTLLFCDELVRLYGHEDYATAAAASWAVENWAAAGFWDQLVAGWEIFRARRDLPQLNIGFFTWHARLEANHAQHTWDELTQWYAEHDVDEDAFIARAIEMLDAVHVFWSGLDRQRREIAGGGPREPAYGVMSRHAVS